MLEEIHYKLYCFSQLELGLKFRSVLNYSDNEYVSITA